MKVGRLILREIAHRKGNFVLGMLSVAVAVGCVIGALTLLQADDIRTEQILSAKQKELATAIATREESVKQAGTALEDATRKIMKGLGFNIWILPEDQDLNEVHVHGTFSKSMPEELVDRLAKSRIVTVNHLLPQVSKKVQWTEKDDQTIILTGTRGEVPLMHRALKKPLQQQVPAGSMVVGYHLHKQHGLKVGDKIKLLGKEFTVGKLHGERGTADDSTIWISLAEAQELFGMQNLVHAILALECNCATKDRLAEIRKEIQGLLPGTQVIEVGPPALARAEARNKAKQVAEKNLADEREASKLAMDREADNRQQLRESRESFVSILVPVVIIACAVWIGFLAYANVRQRSTEIGILRAIGLRSTQILSIFLGKAVAMGLLGAILGCGIGLLIGMNLGDLPPTTAALPQLFGSRLLFLAVVVSPLTAPVLAALASWIPAMLAAQQDPAFVLQEE